MRLIRPVFAGARQENAALRDVARQIAALRDAEVMRRTFETLADALPKSTHQPLRAALDVRRTGAAEPEALLAAVEATRAELQALEARCRGWKLKAREFEAIEPGLTDTWRRARKGHRRARRAFEDAQLPAQPFHDWRKAVKQHWYQARLLEPIWPEMMAPHVAQANILGELLGDHNDLDVLLTTLEADAANLPKRALKPLRREVMSRRQALAREAVCLGGRLLAESPESLADRWGRWWRLWRM